VLNSIREDPRVPRRFSASRLATAVIGIVVIGIAAYWWWFRPAPPPPAATAPSARPARTMTLGQGEGAPVRSFPGRVQAGRGRRADVSFRVPGTLVDLPVKTDQSVAQGQLLARLDPRDFETRVAQAASAVVEARARLTAMQAGDRPEDVRILESQLAAEQARLREAELDLTRTRNLLDRGAATKDAFERATRAFEVAQATTAAATTALGRARAGARVEDIEGQRALIRRLEAQEREARDALADTRLTAPFAGIVARTLAETFQEVPARQPIVSLRDSSGLEIVADVPEFVMVQLGTRNVKSLAAAFDFLPGRTFPLTQAEAETEADPRTRTFAVVFRLPNMPSDIRILPGMTATVLVEAAALSAARPDEWPVPAGAVAVDADGKRYVWRVAPDKQTVHRVPVEPGEVRGDQVVVRGQLRPGDTIVIAGVNHLQEGDTIRAVPPGDVRIR
jgi:RND family efflux transporter MFP subunit